MPKLSGTVARLATRRSAALTDHGGRLDSLPDFGSNPGALRGHIYIPPNLRDAAALVVVLHGCTQCATGYDLGAGWSEMADRHGFALLFPEQQRQNNPNLCFNWFFPEDSRRGSGEALSIRQMIAAVASAYPINADRIFVTGLSAGGAMASVMLATYPEVFSGGAIIAGLPYGCATTIPQAFDRMRGHGFPNEAALANLVRSASDHAGPWPTISVWHGSGDATVNPTNADAIIAQWRALHGTHVAPTRTEPIDGYPRRVWCDATGREVIEEYSITGMGHGTPLDTSGTGCGKKGPYMLEASISSTGHICRFWGLSESDNVAGKSRHARQTGASPAPTLGPTPGGETRSAGATRTRPLLDTPSAEGGVGKVIEDALRAAGLMR